MGSQHITCHLAQVNAPRLTPVMQAGTRFTYPRGMELGWVDLVDLTATRPGAELATSHKSRVRRPTIARQHPWWSKSQPNDDNNEIFEVNFWTVINQAVPVFIFTLKQTGVKGSLYKHLIQPLCCSCAFLIWCRHVTISLLSRDISADALSSCVTSRVGGDKLLTKQS